MIQMDFRRHLKSIRAIFSVILGASVVLFAVRSIHWKFMWDSTIIHYISFLMRHGMAPYRDIIDLNLPGSILIETWGMRLFGGGDIGWRFYDFTLLAILIGAMVIISLPYDWFAGLFAGVFFLLVHAAEGARNAGQREEAEVAFIMAAYAFIFTAMRRHRPFLLLPFGFLIAFAGSIKPTIAPMGVVLLFLAVFVLRKQNTVATPYLLWGLMGMGLAFLTSVGFLYHYDAFYNFVEISRRLTPFYAGIGNGSLLMLTTFLFKKGIFLVFLLGALTVSIANRNNDQLRNWERSFLAIGLLFGLLSYYGQLKIFDHHAYLFWAFLLLCGCIEFSRALKKHGWMSVTGFSFYAVMLIGVLRYDYRLAGFSSDYQQDPFAGPVIEFEQDALRNDLIQLGGARLQNQVQCFDMVAACFGTLYRLQLMPYSGFMGDYMFFGPIGSSPMTYYRNVMWTNLQQKPPTVIVLTNWWFGGSFSFDKLNQWPDLATYLDHNYDLHVTRSFGIHAYRIYVRKGTYQTANSGTSGLPETSSPLATLNHSYVAK